MTEYSCTPEESLIGGFGTTRDGEIDWGERARAELIIAEIKRAAKAEAWLACADEARDCGYLGAIDHEQLIDRDPYREDANSEG